MDPAGEHTCYSQAVVSAAAESVAGLSRLERLKAYGSLAQTANPHL